MVGAQADGIRAMKAAGVPCVPGSDGPLGGLLVAMVNVEAYCRHLGELIRRHHGNVYGYLRRLGAAPDLAEDLTQEVFLRVLQKAGSFRGNGSFFFASGRQTGLNSMEYGTDDRQFAVVFIGCVHWYPGCVVGTRDTHHQFRCRLHFLISFSAPQW